MKKYKIVFISKESIGGTTTYLNQINLLNPKKFEKLLLLFKKEDIDQIEMRKEYLGYDYPKNDFGFSIPKLGIFIRNFCKLYLKVVKEKPDLILTRDQYSLVMGHLLKKVFFKKIVFVCQINNNLEKILESKTKLHAFVLKTFITLSLNNYDLLMYSSEDLKMFIQQKFKIRNKKAIVLFPAVDFKRIRKLAKQGLETLYEEHLLQKNSSFKIFSVGTLNFQKDFSTIIKAFSILRKKRADAELFIIGDGILKEELKREAKSLGVEKQTHFLGWKKNVFSYLKFADLFLFASNYEGLGVVLVEAMVMGIPVVVTDTPFGPSEILEKGKYGILVPIGNYKKMAEYAKLLIEDKKLREKYKRLGLKRTNDYNVELVIKKTENLFLSLLK